MELDEQTATRLRELTNTLREAPDRTESITARRDQILDRLGACSRVREDPDGAVLVIYPASWIDADGTVDPAYISDPDRAVELPLETATREDDWESIHDHNLALASAVRRRRGPVHGATAEAFATYLSNHHLLRIEEASTTVLQTFTDEYFIRNAWPDQEQLALLDRSMEFICDEANRESATEGSTL